MRRKAARRRAIDEEYEEERAEACLVLGLRPAEYDDMSREQIGIWLRAYRRIHKT